MKTLMPALLGAACAVALAFPAQAELKAGDAAPAGAGCTHPG